MTLSSSVRPALHFDPPLAAIPEILRADGIDAFQTTLRNPQRFRKEGVPDAATHAALAALPLILELSIEAARRGVTYLRGNA